MKARSNERVEREHERRVLAVGALEASCDRQATKHALAAACRVVERSIRRWAQKRREGDLEPKLPGPRPRAVERGTRQGVIALLVALGPFASVDAVRALFGEVPFAMIRSMKQRFKRILRRRRGRSERRLTWFEPGRVWACDFTKPKAKLPGKNRLLFVVRDLASGYRLAAVPCKGERAQVACDTLRALFAAHGAPLVLKHDNGPGFRAHATQRLLEEHEVQSLASPVYRPQYNGSVERSLGWTKVRTEHLAQLAGHAGVWTQENIEQARAQANATLRPWGARGPTPHAAFHGRRPITPDERQAFKETMHALLQQELMTRMDERGRIITSTPYEVMRRRSIMRALITCGYLKIRRGRNSTPVSMASPDRIS